MTQKRVSPENGHKKFSFSLDDFRHMVKQSAMERKEETFSCIVGAAANPNGYSCPDQRTYVHSSSG